MMFWIARILSSSIDAPVSFVCVVELLWVGEPLFVISYRERVVGCPPPPKRGCGVPELVSATATWSNGAGIPLAGLKPQLLLKPKWGWYPQSNIVR